VASETRRWITHYTEDGEWYRLWEEAMPRLPDHIVDCSIYLYSSVRAAEGGHASGGSGFLVHVRSEVTPSGGYLYAVTNKHILDEGFNVIRLTKKNGGIQTISTKRDHWVPHPNNYDVEVCPIDLSETSQWWSIGTDIFITKEIVGVYNIGIGDDALLIGRLVTHDGIQRNKPLVRFGSISLMADPSEPVKTRDGAHEAFLVDCRSLSGFSGSPVLVSTEQSYVMDNAKKVIRSERIRRGEPEEPQLPRAKIEPVSITGTYGPWLLGIDCGHIPLWKPVYSEKDQARQFEKPGHWVEANTGIAYVLPAWEVMSVLNREDLMHERRKHDAAVRG